MTLVMAAAYWRGGAKAAILIAIVVWCVYAADYLAEVEERVFEKVQYQMDRGLEMIERKP